MASRRAPFGFTIAVSLLLAPAAVQGQTIKAGTWTGTITPPSAQTIDATFDVSVQGDSVAIQLNGPFGAAAASNVEVHPDRLTFRWVPGTPVSCTLMAQEDGGYAGDCVDANGGKGVIVMHPPAGQEAAAPRAGPLRARAEE